MWAQLAAFGSQLLGTVWKEGDSGLGFVQKEMANVKDNSGRLEGELHSMCPKAVHNVLFPGPFLLCVMLPCRPVVFSVLSHLCLPSFIHTTGLDDFHLSIHSDMATIVKAMASPESGLEVRDRMWLKITIPNAFIGKRLCCLQPRLGLGNGWPVFQADARGAFLSP